MRKVNITLMVPGSIILTVHKAQVLLSTIRIFSAHVRAVRPINRNSALNYFLKASIFRGFFSSMRVRNGFALYRPIPSSIYKNQNNVRRSSRGF